VFVECPRLTELQNVQLASSVAASTMLTDFSTSAALFGDDVTPLTSGVSHLQLTPPSVVPFTACNSGSPTVPAISRVISRAHSNPTDEISSLYALSQLTLGIPRTTSPGPPPGTAHPWIDMETAYAAAAQKYPANFPVTPVSPVFHSLVSGNASHTAVQHPLMDTVPTWTDFTTVDDDDEFFPPSYDQVVTRRTSPEISLFPTPPESLSSSPGLEVSGSAAQGQPGPSPPPYPFRLSARTSGRTSQPSPSQYPARNARDTGVWAGAPWPVLTPRTRRPQQTHEGCTTIRYNRRRCRPDNERRRTHFCDYPGKMRRPLYRCVHLICSLHESSTSALNALLTNCNPRPKVLTRARDLCDP